MNRLTKLQPLLMLARSTNAYSVIVIQMYIFLSQAALEYFDCSLYDDGEYRLDAQPTIKCYDGDWLRYLPLGIFAIILHVVFVPMVWIICQHGHILIEFRPLATYYTRLKLCVQSKSSNKDLAICS